jgi:hypothetical protein
MMDFDHRDPSKKLFTIAGAHALLMSRAKLVAEVEKCDIVCANCHALRTYANLMEVGADQQMRNGLPERHRTSNASGRRFPPCVMQFDHREDALKKFVVSETRSRAHSTILAEVAKCDIVCTNCHRDRTFKRRFAA